MDRCSETAVIASVATKQSSAAAPSLAMTVSALDGDQRRRFAAYYRFDIGT
jgi:hypothetical protein